MRDSTSGVRVIAAPRRAWSPRAPVPEQASAGSARTFSLILLLTLVFAGGLALRLYFLTTAYATPDADQTILGLMARHIQAGERPVFYWGQPYTGSPEAYLTAGLFTIFGQSDLLLHLVPMLASLLFALLVVALAWRLYGAGVAMLCGIYLGVAPELLIDWGFWAGSGYLETMALGTAALLLALPRADGSPSGSWSRLPLAFLLLGFAVWVQPVALYYLLALVPLLVGRVLAVARAPRRWPAGVVLTALCAGLFLLGMAPLLQFNLQNGWATLHFLTNRATHVDTLTVLSRTLLWAGPVVVGLTPPTTDRVYFSRFLLDHYALYGVGLGIVLFLIVRGLSLWRLGWARLCTVLTPRPAADLGLVVLVLALLAGFVSSSWGAEAWSGSQPRYLLPIYTALPLLARLALPRRRRRLAWAIALPSVAVLCLATFYVNGTAFPREDLRPLATLLRARGVTAVYGDYWLIYPLIWNSDERLVGAAVNDDLGKGRNRYSPYLRATAASSHYAWIVRTGSARQRSLLHCLGQLHSTYVTLRWYDQTIYDQPTGRAFPWWNGGRCPTISEGSH